MAPVSFPICVQSICVLSSVARVARCNLLPLAAVGSQVRATRIFQVCAEIAPALPYVFYPVP